MSIWLQKSSSIQTRTGVLVAAHDAHDVLVLRHVHHALRHAPEERLVGPPDPALELDLGGTNM